MSFNFDANTHMMFDIDSLVQKVSQLVEMTLVLRRENAELRLRNAELVHEHKILNERMNLARERVTALINNLPSTITRAEEK